MKIISVSGIAASGQVYEYSNVVTLNQDQIASGVAAHNFRMGQNLGNVRGIGREDADKCSLNGAMGEVVFAVAYNLPFNIYLGKGADFNYCGEDIDVKTSKHQNLLIAERHLNEAPDTVFVAIKKEGYDQFRLIGFIEGKNVKKRGKLINPGNRGNAWLVKMEDLKPFKKMIRGAVEKAEGNPIL